MKIDIGFTGDIAFSEYTKDIYNKPDKIDKEIYDFFMNNDYNIINFESPVTESTLSEKSALTHKSAPESLKYIKNKFNNPILSLANNHMMDFGPRGLLDTLKYLKQEKIEYLGAGKNEEEATKYIIIGNEIKVGIIAVQYKDYYIATANSPGPAQNKHFNIVKKKIKELRKKVDWIVMIYHGGEEFINTPMPYTRRMYKKFLKWGVDVVVAHHPHTVQGYEKINNKMIFYSLGNFIFDTNFQRAQYGTDQGVLIKLQFTKKDYTFSCYPIKQYRDDGKVSIVKKNIYFKDINENYNKSWKNDARKLSKINNNKKQLRQHRTLYSISNLYIKKAEIENMLTFEELVKKHYFLGLNKELDVRVKNKVIRKFDRAINILNNASFKKHFYMAWARVFK